MLQSLRSHGILALVFYALTIILLFVSIFCIAKVSGHDIDAAMDLAENCMLVLLVLFGIGLTCDHTLRPPLPLS
jgi:hypothetical protein